MMLSLRLLVAGLHAVLETNVVVVEEEGEEPHVVA